MSERFKILAPTKEEQKKTKEKRKEQSNPEKPRKNIFKRSENTSRFDFLEDPKKYTNEQDYSDCNDQRDRDWDGDRDRRRDGDRGRDRDRRRDGDWGRDRDRYEDNRGSFNSRSSGFRQQKRGFRESFFARKKFFREYESKNEPKKPKNFSFKEDDFPTL